MVIVFHRQWLDLRGSQEPGGQSHDRFLSMALMKMHTQVSITSCPSNDCPLRFAPTPTTMLQILVAVVAQPSSVSAQGVFAAAALAAAASQQLLGELQTTAAHVRPGDPRRTRHAEEDP